MFTALSSDLTSLKTVLDKVSDDTKLLFKSEYGDIDLGTDTKVNTYFKIYRDDQYSDVQGLLYNHKTKDGDNNVMSRRRIITYDINFNVKNFSFCKSTQISPTTSLSGQTLIINGTTVTFTTETTFEEVIETISSYDIDNIGSYLEDSYLIIYSTKLSQNDVEYTNLTLDGTSVSNLGLISGTFNDASSYFLIRGIKYDIKDYEDGINNYVKYFYVSRG